MSTLLHYLFEANMALLFCGVSYYLLLRRDTHFLARRIYILAATAFCLLLPFLHLDLWIQNDEREVVKSIQTLVMPEIVITAGNSESSAAQASPIIILSWIYLLGTSLLTGYLLFRLAHLLFLFLSKPLRYERLANYVLIHSNGSLPTFSFFKWIILDNSVPLSTTERSIIIEHELAHIRQRHSLDLIFLELVKIFFWMNPVCWYFRSELAHVHEYLADEHIAKKTNPDAYSVLLAKMALNNAHIYLGHPFSKSKTLKRIKMMKTPKTILKRWKVATFLPFLALMVLVYSCNDEAMNDMQSLAENANMTADLPPEAQAKMAELEKEYPDARFNYIEWNMDDQKKVKELEKYAPNTIAWISENKNESGEAKGSMIVRVNGAFSKPADMTQKDEVFTIVEKMAEPKGGMDNFYKYIADNLNYPEQAKNNGTEGRVFVEFIVDTDGSLTNLKVRKGIGDGCDEEALRVLSNAPAWNVAEQRGNHVKQKLILPISFSLGQEASSDQISPTVLQQNMIIKMSRINESGEVTGSVHTKNGTPLADVNIVVRGTSSGTITNDQGAFRIPVDKGARLVFSYVGFETVYKKVE